MAESHRLVNPQKILVKDLNSCLTCTLCGGYLIDATTVVDCSHTFCRACIVRHFESSRLCPSCGSLVHKNKPLSKLRSDTTLQSLVYKSVPSLYSKELQRRADFYHSTSFRANSSCSDDSVLGDRTQDSEEWVASNIGDPSLYFSPDDSISLSVEYYTKEALESCDSKPEKTNSPSDALTNSINNNNNTESIKPETLTNGDTASATNTNNSKTISENKEKSEVSPDTKINETESGLLVSGLTHKRYLQCPAAVRMSHLMKFLRMKFALSNEHRVDIIYAGEVLPPYLSLMDVAYTFKWNREKPMRFFYLIYIPVLRQVVSQPPSTSTTAVTTAVTPPAAEQPPIPPLKLEIPNKPDIKDDSPPTDTKITKKHKEIKIKEPVKPEVVEEKKEDNNNTKISSKSKIEKPEKSLTDGKSSQKSVKFVDNYFVKPLHNVEYKVKINDSVQASTVDNCVYEYSEPDKDEIKAFAERRDREWALQKYPEAHVSKKRKKNKHSKNEFMHKKRKLHAEITSNEVLSNTDDSLKLKVKLSVANGHKHKHRSSSNSNSVAAIEPIKTQELSPKERLLQMRQVRHKPVCAPLEEKPKNNPSEPNLKMVITADNPKPKPESSRLTEKSDSNQKFEQKSDIFTSGKTLRSDFSKPKPESLRLTEKSESNQKFEQKSDIFTTGKTLRSDFSKPKPESPRLAEKSENNQKSEQKSDILTTGKTLRSDFSNKTSLSKDICSKFVRVSLEKFGDKNNLSKKSLSNNLTVTKASEKDESRSRNLEGKTEIIPIENKNIDNKVGNSSNNKLPDSGLSIKLADKTNGSKILDNKFNANNKILDNKVPHKSSDVKTNNVTTTENKTIEQKQSKTIENKVNSKTTEMKINLKPTESKIVNKTVDMKVVQNKTNEQSKMTDPKLLSPKPIVKTEPKSPIDESKLIENKLNNIDFKTSQSTFVTKNFTVSKVESGTKRKLESPEMTSDKVPSLEITVINVVTRPPQTSSNQTNPTQAKTNSVPSKLVSSTQTKPSVSEAPPAKKIRPPPLTIPLGRIQKMNTANKSNVQKPAEKCDIFGALDLSAKPTNKSEIKANEFRAHSASPKTKIQDQIQNMIRPKTPIKTGQDAKSDSGKPLQRPNISNLQMLSESAVQIRDLMAKGSPLVSIPNLIKKTPPQTSSQKSVDFLQKSPHFQQKPPNLIPKTPQTMPKNISNFIGKPPNFVSKNLQKLPKLNEISKGQFCRLNVGQIRPPRPAGQNQTVRNIPNPSLLVRQQNQNRINSLNNSNSSMHETQKPDVTKPKTETSETEKRSENKTSEPPPLKPIESFKK